MPTLYTGNRSVKLNTGSTKAVAYRSTNRTVRYSNPNSAPTFEKVAGSGPYVAGTAPSPTPTTSSPFVYFGQVSLVPADAETTIATYTVAGNQIVYLQGFQACGDADAMYTLYVNNQIVAMARTTPANLNAYVNLLSGTPNVPGGMTIKLTVICTIGGVQFNGTLLGYYTAT